MDLSLHSKLQLLSLKALTHLQVWLLAHSIDLEWLPSIQSDKESSPMLLDSTQLWIHLTHNSSPHNHKEKTTLHFNGKHLQLQVDAQWLDTVCGWRTLESLAWKLFTMVCKAVPKPHLLWSTHKSSQASFTSLEFRAKTVDSSAWVLIWY
jgi:hypothetical protein